ncbi:hypothetical protein KAT08_02295 [Candidatus Babeliales bacterium]|nr:hypothetical protein [Candidatus Babeliales bacterium]
MKKYIKRIIISIIILISIVLIGYGGYRLYDYAVTEATKRIKEGVKEGIGSAINPLSWPRKIFKK